MIVTKLPRRTVRRLKALGLAYEENGVLFPTALGVTMKGARNLAQWSRDHQEEFPGDRCDHLGAEDREEV